MNTIRQNRVARLIQKELAIIFQEHSYDLFQNKIITVTIVRISADLSVCKVYVSIFPYNEKENFIEYLNMQKKVIRNFLAQRIRNQVRIIPELIFYRDDSIDYANRIDELLKK